MSRVAPRGSESQSEKTAKENWILKLFSFCFKMQSQILKFSFFSSSTDDEELKGKGIILVNWCRENREFLCEFFSGLFDKQLISNSLKKWVL